MPIADDLVYLDPEHAEELAALGLNQPVVEPQLDPAQLPNQQEMVNPLAELAPAEQDPVQQLIQPAHEPNHPNEALPDNNNIEQNPNLVDLNAPPEQLPELRSRSTRLPSYISFRNSTERIVDVYWVDYKGQCVHYKSIEPSRRLDLNTYETHPWVFRDHTSRAKLVVNNREVFMPRHFPLAFRPDPSGDVRPKRVSYDITIPIYSLKERATQVVLSLAQSEANISQLELPAMLRQELQFAIYHRNTRPITP